jgi:CubicO group peptidase (beta-lactamase class C family)
LARKGLSAPAHAQAAQFPSTPAGQQLSQLLAAFNTGDRDTMRKYLEVNFPERLSKLDEDLRFRQGTGGFDFKTVEDSKPLRLVSIVKEKNSDQFARATLQVEEGPAHRITDFNLQAIPTPPEFVVAQGPEVADSPAERQFRAWLAVFSEGDRAALLKFFTDNYPSEVARIDGDLNFRQGTGGFDFRKAVSATATQFTALVQERGSDQFARAVVTVEPNEPHRILSVGLRAIPRPPEFAIPRLTEAELVQQLGSKLKEDAKNGLFAGAVLVARQGKPVFTGAYGMANRETAQPNKLTTRFRMGSMNKMFTATAIMQLLQAGKIKLDDPLGKFLTDYPNKDVASKVTIHHLLTHTGGTGDIFGPEFDSHRLQLRTLNDYITLYGSRGLAFEPGKQWDYSNYGFILLGAIVERVSGQSYYDYVRDHIFVPAGMTRTASEPEDVAVPDRATGYMRDGSSSKPNTETLPYRGTSAGGGYTTVEDLLRFANALTQHKLLNENYTQLLTTAKPETGDAHYAYGFEDDVVRGVRSFGHSGGAPGMNGDLLIFPQTGYVVVALANMDRGAQREASWISERLPAQ